MSQTTTGVRKHLLYQLSRHVPTKAQTKTSTKIVKTITINFLQQIWLRIKSDPSFWRLNNTATFGHNRGHSKTTQLPAEVSHFQSRRLASRVRYFLFFGETPLRRNICVAVGKVRIFWEELQDFQVLGMLPIN